MTTRRDNPQPGIEARWPDTCPRCDQPIVPGHDRIVFRRGRPIHVECASGAEDE